MATVGISQDIPNLQLTSTQSVTLIDQAGDVVTLPIVAPTTQYGELAPNWTQVPRPGVVEPAYNVRGPRPLRQITLQVTVASYDAGDPGATLDPIDDTLHEITEFLQDATSIRLSYAKFDNTYITPSGQWICKSWQPAVITRDPQTWSPISVQGNLVLEEANQQPFVYTGNPNALYVPGPNSTLTGPMAASQAASTLFQYGSTTGASTPSGTAPTGTGTRRASVATSPSAASKNPPGTPKQVKYTVVAGDTLTSISMKMYGVPNGWNVIGQANQITDPRYNLGLTPGRVLIIPGGVTSGYTIQGQGPAAQNPFGLSYTNLNLSS